MIQRLLTQEAQIIPRTRTGAEDDFGTPTWVDGPPVTEYIVVQPRTGSGAGSTEFEGPALGEAPWAGWFKVDTVATPRAKIIMSWGLELEVDGLLLDWPSPRTGKVEYKVAGLVEAS
jgi:hypothetical protein